MVKHLIAKASVTIDASPQKVWKGLVTPEAIKQYMFGADVETDWKVGSDIKWKGEMKGEKFEDKGKILKFEPEKTLAYTHFSPMMGKEDVPENYHTVTITLAGDNGLTTVNLSQDNNSNDEARGESERNWGVMLEGLKKCVESTE